MGESGIRDSVKFSVTPKITHYGCLHEMSTLKMRIRQLSEIIKKNEVFGQFHPSKSLELLKLI